jgi:hypothetical protein
MALFSALLALPPLLLLLLLFSPSASATPTCTPIYAGCVCETPPMSCSTLEFLQSNITAAFYAQYSTMSAGAMKKDPAGLSRAAGEFIGGAVRLVFHDAAEFDAGSPPHPDGKPYRSDGCVHVAGGGHAGLSRAIDALDVLWRPVCGLISRADFWVLAAQAMMTEATPYSATRRGSPKGLVLTRDDSVNRRRLGLDDEGGGEEEEGEDRAAPTPTSSSSSSSNHPYLAPRELLRGASAHDHVIFAFRYGRVDRADCAYTGPTRMPDAELGVGEITRALTDRFSLSTAETVALMGAHTLGLAAMDRSGYNNSWKDRPDLLTITYFKLLAVSDWRRDTTSFREPGTNRPLQQWIHDSTSPRNLNALMLNTDMQLLYDIDPSVPSKNAAASCSRFATSVAPGNVVLAARPAPNCPFLSASLSIAPSSPARSFSTYVLQFAEGDTPSQDEPGASRWLSNFTRAWKKMTEIGYGGGGDGDLHCIDGCVPSFCPACTAEEFCNGQTDFSLLPEYSYLGQGAIVSSNNASAPQASGSPGGGSAASTPRPSPAPLPPPQVNVTLTLRPAGSLSALRSSGAAVRIREAMAAAVGIPSSNIVLASVRTDTGAVYDLHDDADINDVGFRRRALQPQQQQSAAAPQGSLLLDLVVTLPVGTSSTAAAQVVQTAVQANGAALSTAVSAWSVAAGAGGSGGSLAVASVATSASPAPAPAQAVSAGNDKDGKDGKLSSGAIGGIAAGVVVLALGAAGVVGRALARRRGSSLPVVSSKGGA